MIDSVVVAKSLVEAALLTDLNNSNHSEKDKPNPWILAREHILDLIQQFLTEDNTHLRQELYSSPTHLFYVLLFLDKVGDRRDTLGEEDLSLEDKDKERVNQFLHEVRGYYPLHQCPVQLIPLLYANSSREELKTAAVGRPSPSSLHNHRMTMESDGGSSGSPSSSSSSLNFDAGAVEFVLNHGIGICATGKQFACDLIPNRESNIKIIICIAVEEMRTAFVSIGTQKLTPPAVARIMNGLWKAYDQGQNEGMWGEVGGKDKPGDGSWSLKPFAQAATELVPTLVWKEVIRELDFQGLYMRDGKGFRAFMEGLKHGMQIQGQGRSDQFPIELFYRRWINTGVDAQIFFFKALLNPVNFDVFYLPDYPHHAVSTEMLKTSGDKGYDVKEIAIWKSIDLLDILLSLSDAGNYPVIQDMFQFPILHCPDLLLLGLTQVSSPVNVLRQELIGALLPIFLGNHINSGVLLQYIWHNGSSSLRPIMIHSMAEWYLRGEYDQTKLSRILDIAQDLKALQLLLNASSHVFIIDLACLASRREFLKLDKWLSDKIREHGESFVASIVKVLKRRVPFILGKDDNIPKSAQLPPETLTVLMQCLNQCVGKVNQELSDTILNMSNTVTNLLNLSRPSPGPPSQQQQPPPGVLRPPHRNINPDSAFNPSSSGPGQLFPSQSDPLSSLGSSFGGLALSGSGSGGGGTSGGGNFGFNPLGGGGGQTPGSPSRLLGPGFNSQNPAASSSSYPMLSGLQMGPNPGAPNVAAVSAALMGGISNPMGMLGGGRLGPQGPGGASQSAIGSNGGPLVDKRSGIPDAGLLFTEMQGEISKEAEDEANTYFHRIYSKPPVSWIITYFFFRIRLFEYLHIFHVLVILVCRQ